jgi:hypothetical protein
LGGERQPLVGKRTPGLNSAERSTLISTVPGPGTDVYAALHQSRFDHGVDVHERFDGDPDYSLSQQLTELSTPPETVGGELG